MKIIILSLFIVFVMANIQSCHDAFDLEENIAKDSLNKKLNADDSVNFLELQDLDIGSIKFGASNELPVFIRNKTSNMKIVIYNIEHVNKTGLFNLKLASQLPITLAPGELAEGNKTISVKFVAGAYNLGYYYDTLYLNYTKKNKILIKAKIKY